MIREFGWIDVLYLVLAMRWTLALTVTAFVGGGLIGLVIAVLRVSRVWPLQAIAVIYVQAIQGTPLLVLLFVFFFGLSIWGCRCSLDRRRPRLLDLCRGLSRRDL